MMKNHPVELSYISVGCNPTSGAADWSDCGLVAYGGCNSVLLYRPNRTDGAGRVESVLNAHKGRVNCVKWMSSSEGNICKELVSGSSDKTLIHWRHENNEWKAVQVLSKHTNAVCGVATVNTGDESSTTFIASAGADSKVMIWKRSEHQEFVHNQTLSFGNGFVLAIAMSTLPCTCDPVLFCGSDDTNIQLYTLDSDSQFSVSQRLVGHEDWIRCMSTVTDDQGNLYVASGSQDTYIRLWKISKATNFAVQDEDQLTITEQKFTSNNVEFVITLESVLISHEGWVLGVSWSKAAGGIPKLVSASMDKTMIIWEFNSELQVWMDEARMGEVGGNTLGFYGCCYGPSEKQVLAHGYQGAFHLWEESTEKSSWKPCVTVSGHFASVEDLDWEHGGEFLVSVSADQTARLHSQWKRSDNIKNTWHEIARPQIHGYNMKCLKMLSRYKYVSGAEEKVVRVFEAPQAFYNTLKSISQTKEDDQNQSNIPLGASVPPLGLSNKAVYAGDIDAWSDDKADPSMPMKASAFASDQPAPFKPTAIEVPPVEDVLLQNTLWPESEKLYGHGYEIFCLAASPDGSVVASACKASKADYANILVWSTDTWKQMGSLNAHGLTITQMEFSHNGQYLLSVSRDRTWALFKRNENSPGFKLIQKTDKKTGIHSRIIWSCSWAPCDTMFVTASRDKKLIAWSKVTNGNGEPEKWESKSSPLDVGDAATAVSILPVALDGKYLVGVGTETGLLKVYFFQIEEKSWTHVLDVEKSLCPTGTVKRLCWRPCKSENFSSMGDISERTFQLAVGSSDHSVRILDVSCF